MERFPRNPFSEIHTIITLPNWRYWLSNQYHTGKRFYHNDVHLNKIWSYYNALYYKEGHYKVMLLTTLFHDSIYEPGAKNNEIESAKYFEQWCWQQENARLIFTYDEFKGIRDTIIATADHTNPKNEDLPEWGKIFLDLDLYELGSSKEIFKKNSVLIRNEFGEIDDLLFYKGRLKWLEHMMASERIFWIFENREEQARINLANEHVEISLKIEKMNGQL